MQFLSFFPVIIILQAFFLHGAVFVNIVSYASMQGLWHGLFNQTFKATCFLPITYAAVILILQHNELPLLPFPNRLPVLRLISLGCTHQCVITGSETMPVSRHLVHAYSSLKKPLPAYTGICSSGKYPFLPRLACLLQF